MDGQFTTLDLRLRFSLVAAANIVAVLDGIGTCLGSAGLTFGVTGRTDCFLEADDLEAVDDLDRVFFVVDDKLEVV